MVIWMGISRPEKLLPKKVGKILDFPAEPVIIETEKTDRGEEGPMDRLRRAKVHIFPVCASSAGACAVSIAEYRFIQR